VSVVRREARRRWSLVGVGVAALCLSPVAVAAWPTPRVDTEPLALRELILGSAAWPYQGYVDTRGEINLPDLPALGDVVSLAGGATRIRVWYASAQSWRVAVLDQTGERDIYQTVDGTYVWDFERNLVTFSVGELPVRLPWAADLLPPDLARRLLAGAGTADTLTAIESRWVAGIAAAGLRLTPTDPATTIGRVDVWADPATGLPLRVEVSGRDSARPFFTARFLDLDRRAPDEAVVTPVVAESAGYSVTTAQNLAAALGSVAPVELPDSLAGRPRTTSPVDGVDVAGVGAYGAGLSTFVVLALPGRVGSQAIQAARDRGGTPVTLPNGQGYETSTSLISALIVRSDGDRRTRRTFLLAGSVVPEVLRSAGRELLAASPVVR
jgi:hypothetical protein